MAAFSAAGIVGRKSSFWHHTQQFGVRHYRRCLFGAQSHAAGSAARFEAPSVTNITSHNARLELSSSPPSVTQQQLPRPTVVYTDNHLLVINKPPGWHSVPNAEAPSLLSSTSKCLLTYLQSMQMGGGSQRDYLLSLHRIDQPCSGLILWGKTSKAASRISQLWKQGRVQKEYLCVVSNAHLASLEEAAAVAAVSQNRREDNDECMFQDDDDVKGWKRLEGDFVRPPKQRQQRQPQQQQPRQGGPKRRRAQTPKGSVSVLPITWNANDELIGIMKPTTPAYRRIGLDWKVVSGPNDDDDFTLLRIRTHQGARHMVRALLSQIGGCPIVGDLRYGNNSNNLLCFSPALPDRSVALHAWRVQLLDSTFRLGSLSTFDFEAPVPSTWKHYFSIDDSLLESENMQWTGH